MLDRANVGDVDSRAMHKECLSALQDFQNWNTNGAALLDSSLAVSTRNTSLRASLSITLQIPSICHTLPTMVINNSTLVMEVMGQEMAKGCPHRSGSDSPVNTRD
jgi:hypothetical protein